MIPILYESTETNFKSNGLGRLSDCISCVVHEERNGVYECEFEYPITGAHYDEIIKGRIIACVHDEVGDIQPFDIYKRTAPIDGVVTFFAHHISYRQNGIVVKPFTASSCTQAMQGLKTNSTSTNPFTYWTNKSVNASFSLDIPKTLKALLGGVEGSILDVFGTGEYEFDKFTVKLHTHRGDDTGIQIRYGKNLIDLQDDIDCTDCYTGVVPYWINSSGETQELVHLSTWVVDSGKPTYGSRSIIIPMDLTGEFETKPTETQLREKALAKLNDNEPWLPKESITVDFVQLWQTEEYKNILKFKNDFPDFSLSVILQILKGSNPYLSPGSDSYVKKYGYAHRIDTIKEGCFEIKDIEFSYFVARSIMQYKPYCRPGLQIYKQAAFATAMITLLRKRNFDNSEMARRAELYPTRFYRCTNAKEYIVMLEELWNYKRQKKVHFDYQ